MTVDTRLLAFALWGVGTILVYGVVLFDRWRSWRLHRDRRAKRELAAGFGLFLTALAAGGSIAFVLFGPAGAGIRSLFVATALGAFAAVGLVMATSRPKDVRR